MIEIVTRAHGSATTLAVPALAQPVGRPARVVIGFPPGGSSDIVARLYAQRLSGGYAPNVLVDGRVGAAGRIAVEYVRDADKDGTVYLQTPASMLTLQPHIFPAQVRYDALTDLIPVSTVCSFPFALIVPMAHPARDLAAFVAWAKTQQGEVPFASPAAGAAPHFLGLILGQKIGVRFTHVPYRGAVPAIQDVIGNRLNMFIGVLGDVTPHHNQGVRMLAVSSTARVPRYPDVPTFAELGYPEMNQEEWFGAALPAGTPAGVVQALFDAIKAASVRPDMLEALGRLEFANTTSASPAAFAAQIRAEREMWGPVVRNSGFTPE